MRLLAGCLALLVNLTATSAVAAASLSSSDDPKFQGIPLQCFVSLADTSKSAEAKVAAYTEIAGKYLEFKKLENAKQILEKSLAAAKEITAPSVKAFALLDTASRFGKADAPQLAKESLELAVSLTKELSEPVDKVFANIKIAQAYNEIKEKDKARDLLLEAAKETPEIIEPYVRSRAFSAIANAYTDLNEDFASEAAISAATDLLPMIEDRNAKTRARVEIAGSYALASNHAKAVASLDAVFQEFDAIRDNAISQAKQAAETAKKPAPKAAPILIGKKALKQTSVENTKAAEPKPDVSEELKAQEQFEIANAELLKTRSLFLVASQYIASKQYDRALEVLSNLNEQSLEKSVGTANVAIAYAKDQKTEEASKLFEQSLNGLARIAPSIDSFTLILEIGRQYHMIKSTDLASKTFDRALEVAENLPQPADRLFALNNIASAYGEFGFTDKVAPILETSLELAKTAPDPNIRSRAFSDISSTYWAIDLRDRAKEIAADIQNSVEKEQLNKLFDCAS
ncbi:MAG: hypothetical protein DCE90_01580 [Pseudanabaena sp.]|nr:MAG: hypothetical protein DCE90_01580 [Pseudanabaena sp.]